MFLQRLKIDRDGDLNYDYMGSAEFERGTTRFSRSGLAAAFNEDDLSVKKVDLSVKWGINTFGPVTVLAIGRSKMISSLPDKFTIPSYKENARIECDDYVGWLSVDPHFGTGHDDSNYHPDPLLFMRADVDNLGDLLSAYLEPAVESFDVEFNATKLRNLLASVLKKTTPAVAAKHPDLMIRLMRDAVGKTSKVAWRNIGGKNVTVKYHGNFFGRDEFSWLIGVDARSEDQVREYLESHGHPINA